VFGRTSSPASSTSSVPPSKIPVLRLGRSLLLFNNTGADGGGFGAVRWRVLEYSVNEAAHEASVIWQYETDAGTFRFGDAKRLPNGSTLIGYSNDGKIYEVSPFGQTLRVTAVSNDGQGYLDWRASLYGPPQKSRSQAPPWRTPCERIRVCACDRRWLWHRRVPWLRQRQRWWP
jgi:hypothetical protein